MNVSKEELVKIIDLCWDAASDAKMHGLPMGMGTVKTPDGRDFHVFETFRTQTYQTLLNCLLPKAPFRSEIETIEAKQPWQE